jgi:hypothetical protein
MRQPSSLVALLLVAACSEPPAPTEPSAKPSSATQPSATQPSAKPSASASASTSASAKPSEEGLVTITREEAKAAKMPDIGLRLGPIKDTWVASTKPQMGTYVSLGGPPGGTLMFVVRGYTGRAAKPEAIAPLYQDYLKWAGITAADLAESKPTTVKVAGAERPAQAFVFGKPPARGNWCVILVASPRSETEGLMLLAGVSGDDAPSCEPSLTHPAIAPVLASLQVD